jgi:hypothetical protein
MLGFQDFYSASEALKGIEALNMVKKTSQESKLL